MMQEYCIREKQRQIEEIQDNYNYRAQNTRQHTYWAVIKQYYYQISGGLTILTRQYHSNDLILMTNMSAQ